jgi:AraC-like DNA-binding protein
LTYRVFYWYAPKATSLLDCTRFIIDKAKIDAFSIYFTFAFMADQPIIRISSSDLDILMGTLEVHFVALSQCFVSPGYRLVMGGHNASGIHYNLTGMGKIFIGEAPPISIFPHTLIVVPPNSPFRIEVTDRPGESSSLKTVDGSQPTRITDGVRQFIAGDTEPGINLICGYFHASYGTSTDLFGTLSSPIVEQFDANDQLDNKLNSALTELGGQKPGSGAMSSALLKQVIVQLLRRSLHSINTWVERFSMLSDPQIAKAFANMTADPGANYTTQSLAAIANLSRSAFMARFNQLIGKPPMVVLRDLRMRQAAQQLKAGYYSIDQITRNAGYKSRSSFMRAFQNAYGRDLSEYRAAVRTDN